MLIAAIKDLTEEVRGLADAVTNFAESFTTKELRFDRAYGHELTVDWLCVGQVCVSESQFMAVFGQTAGAATSQSVPSSPSNQSVAEATSTQSEAHANEASDITNSEQRAHEHPTPEPPPAPPSPEASADSQPPALAASIQPIAPEPANDSAPPAETATSAALPNDRGTE